VNTRDISNAEFAQRMRLARERSKARNIDQIFNHAQQAIVQRVKALLYLQEISAPTEGRVMQVLYTVLLEWAEDNQLGMLDVRRGNEGTFVFGRTIQIVFGGIAWMAPAGKALHYDGVIGGELIAPHKPSDCGSRWPDRPPCGGCDRCLAQQASRDAGAEAYGLRRAAGESDESLRLRTDWAADRLSEQRRAGTMPATLMEILGYNRSRDIESAAALHGDMLTTFAGAWGVSRFSPEVTDVDLLGRLAAQVSHLSPEDPKTPKSIP
jgi:hypothetical protein